MANDTEQSGLSSKGTDTSGITQSELDDAIKEATKKFDSKINEKAEELTKEFARKIDEKEVKTTEILAIFITLFTFVSVNINIFTRVSNVYTAMWFMLMMTFCSLVILSSLFICINSRGDRKTWFGLFCALVVIILLIVISMHPQRSPKLNSIENQQVR